MKISKYKKFGLAWHPVFWAPANPACSSRRRAGLASDGGEGRKPPPKLVIKNNGRLAVLMRRQFPAFDGTEDAGARPAAGYSSLRRPVRNALD
jgi:hypothetical protein